MLLVILEIIISVILIGVILLQAQGSGISGAFGGGGEFYRSRRSFEKILIWVTVISTAIFAIVSILLLVHR